MYIVHIIKDFKKTLVLFALLLIVVLTSDVICVRHHSSGSPYPFAVHVGSHLFYYYSLLVAWNYLQAVHSIRRRRSSRNIHLVFRTISRTCLLMVATAVHKQRSIRSRGCGQRNKTSGANKKSSGCDYYHYHYTTYIFFLSILVLLLLLTQFDTQQEPTSVSLRNCWLLWVLSIMDV